MDLFKIRSAAKINLGLDVLDKKEDGYHNIKTIMHSINIFDCLSFSKSDKIIISCENSLVPCDETNLVYRCIKEISKKSGNEDKLLKANIIKTIPVAAGLGGGSADGAAALVAYNKIYNLNLDEEELIEIAKNVGADIPFLIKGGCAICEGIGEKMRVLNPHYSYFIVLCKPNFGISTKEAYDAVDKYSVLQRPDFQALMEGLNEADPIKLKKGLINVFEPYLFKKYPVLGQIKDDISSFAPLGVQMSGSGPSIFGIFSDKNDAKRAYENLSKKYKETYVSTF